MRSSFIIILGAGLFALGGCDRQSEPAPQAKDAVQTTDSSESSYALDRSEHGAPMPDSEFADPDGANVTLAKFRGKPLLVNLWATWCVPCVKEMPTLDSLAEREGERLKILTISQDSKGMEVVRPWFDKRDFKHLEAYVDAENALGLRYASGMLPTTILYDADGREVWRVTGGMDWDGPEARKLIDEAFGAGG